MTTLLDRKKLLQKEPLKTVKVDLGDGEHVFVREMTGRERDQFERSLYEVKEDTKSTGRFKYERRLEDFRAKIAVNTLCDEKGDLLLQPEDYAQLSKSMKASKLDKIANAAQELNRITPEDKEFLVKNSDGGPAADSNSGSAKS